MFYEVPKACLFTSVFWCVFLQHAFTREEMGKIAHLAKLIRKQIVRKDTRRNKRKTFDKERPTH